MSFDQTTVYSEARRYIGRVPIEFRPSSEQDLPGIIALMQAAFNARPDAPFLSPELLRWKYFEANSDWGAGSRSFVLQNGDKLLAHGCAWPVRIEASSGPYQAICLIDWVSVKDVPGMGILLARKIGDLAPVVLSIGGSEMTQKIMPKIGFTKKGELLSYARVLRPWRQFRMRPDRGGVRAVPKLVRNLTWSQASGALAQGWTAVDGKATGYEFMLRCPGARLSVYDLRNSNQPSGGLLLSRVRDQSRIADLWVGGHDDQDLASAYAAVIEAARRDCATCELTALAPDGRTRRALEANGFQQRACRSVFVHDPQSCLTAEDYPLRLNMLADDAAYLDTPEHPFLT